VEAELVLVLLTWLSIMFVIYDRGNLICRILVVINTTLSESILISGFLRDTTISILAIVVFVFMSYIIIKDDSFTTDVNKIFIFTTITSLIISITYMGDYLSSSLLPFSSAYTEAELGGTTVPEFNGLILIAVLVAAIGSLLVVKFFTRADPILLGSLGFGVTMLGGTFIDSQIGDLPLEIFYNNIVIISSLLFIIMIYFVFKKGR